MLPFHLVDAFTSSAFNGNQAAVFILDQHVTLKEEVMQNIASEFNLSASVFVQKIFKSDTTPDNTFSIRWFAPKGEIPVCGHGTLAAAHILFETTDFSSVCFQSCIGNLLISKERHQGQTWISMGFPKREIHALIPPLALLSALDCIPEEVFEDELIYIAILPSPEDVKRLEPNLSLIKTLPKRAVAVTAKVPEDKRHLYQGAHFVSRYFAPKVGIPEDPVCGSLHTRIAPFWGERLGLESMIALKLSERGGILSLEYKKGKHLPISPSSSVAQKSFQESGEVIIKGQAVTVAEGNILKNIEKICCLPFSDLDRKDKSRLVA